MATRDQLRFSLRPLRDSDVPEYAEMLYNSFNAWYWQHGWGKDYFGCTPGDTSIFYEIYNDLTPGSSVAAFDHTTGRMIGACFYHPREHHLSLGIMSVHPSSWGRGVGRSLIAHVLEFARENGYDSCRLVGSAFNMNSFSLYNRSGFIPRGMYHDMMLNVPAAGPNVHVPGQERVREAVLEDVAGMGELEMAVSGIRREMDYRYAILNPRGVLHASVYEGARGEIEGFMISVQHPALNMAGPCVARSEETALALIGRAMARFRGAGALLVVPMDKRKMVEQLYEWGARNVEIHLKQVRGEFQPFNGVSLPGFLPETG